MRKYILFITAILSIVKLSAQEVSTEDVSRLIDKLNCEAVQLSLNENGSNYINNCNCDNNPNFIAIKESIPIDQSATIALCDEIQKLKLNGNRTMSGKSSIIEYLSEGVFNESKKYSKIFKFSESRKTRPDFLKWKESLKSKLRDLLDKVPDIDTITQKENIPNEVNERQDVDALHYYEIEKENDIRKSKDEKLITFNINVISLFFTFLIGIFLFFLLKPKKIEVASDNKKKDSKVKILEEKLDKIEQIVFSSSYKNKSNFDFKGLADEIYILRKEIDAIKSKVFNENLVVSNSQNTFVEAIIKPQVFEEKKAPIEVIYLPNPDMDGSFNDSSSSKTYIKGTHIFRLTKINSQRANFQIEDDESAVRLALTYYDKFIIPVCESENQFQDNYKRIYTQMPGEVSLENGKWIITRKARIKYES
jgi:hypothetical protein